MAKKIIGTVMIVLAGLALIGSLLPANTFNAITILVYLLMAATGILVITYDGGNNLNYYVGYKRRKIQNLFVVILFIPFCFFLLVTSFSFGMLLSSWYDNPYFLIPLLSLCLYGFVTLVLGFMLGNYCMPYRACKKRIPNYDLLVEENLANNNMSPCSADQSIMANDKVLFFPKQYCMIPFDMIESYKYKNVLNIEHDIFIKLVNGKTVLILNKNFNDIKTAIDAHKNAQ